ncbi:MAG TPA: hypothetical protein VIL85_07880 [Thermomicrobiales bacterium]|jgi:hypothetical protein
MSTEAFRLVYTLDNSVDVVSCRELDGDFAGRFQGPVTDRLYWDEDEARGLLAQLELLLGSPLSGARLRVIRDLVAEIE